MSDDGAGGDGGLGLPALISALVLARNSPPEAAAAISCRAGSTTPMGYINGTAGLLVMGIWPWLALAETAQTRRLRAAAIGAAALIASTAVLTQSRAIVLATMARSCSC